MSTKLLSDELWHELEQFFPEQTLSAEGGRPPVPNRVVFTCVLFVLKTGIYWEELPLEFGCSHKTCKRRLRDWFDYGVLEQVYHHLMTQVRSARGRELAKILLDADLVRTPLHEQILQAGEASSGS
jgi:transposase